MNPLTICFALCSVVGFSNLYRLWRDKRVMGVSYFPSIVYCATNAFECFYFGIRHDYFTAFGASLMFTGTFGWLILAWRYSKLPVPAC